MEVRALLAVRWCVSVDDAARSTVDRGSSHDAPEPSELPPRVRRPVLLGVGLERSEKLVSADGSKRPQTRRAGALGHEEKEREAEKRTQNKRDSENPENQVRCK